MMRDLRNVQRIHVCPSFLARGAAALLASPFLIQGLAGCGEAEREEDYPTAALPDETYKETGNKGEEGRCGAGMGAVPVDEDSNGEPQGEEAAESEDAEDYYLEERPLESVDADPGPGEVPPTPVYNVLLNQEEHAVENAIVLDAKPLDVVFYLGPRADDSQLDESEVAPSPETTEVLARQLQTNLLINMTCWVCENQPTLSSAITYDREAGISDQARFSIVPRWDMTTLRNDQRSGYGNLTFGIIVDGKHVDNVALELYVSRDPQPALTDAPRGLSNDELPADSQWEHAIAADLDITVQQVAGTLRVTLNPHHSELKKEFGFTHLDSNLKQLREFNTQSRTSDIFSRIKMPFAELAALFHESGPLIDTVLEGGGEPDTAAGSAAGFSEETKERIVELAWSMGRTVYQRLFERNSDLLRLMQAVERVGGTTQEPLKLRIITNGLQLPWQMLTSNPRRDNATADMKSFWGMKYVLAPYVVVVEAVPPARRVVWPSFADELLVAAYADDQDLGEAARELTRPYWSGLRFREEGRVTAETPMTYEGVLVADSEDFAARLRDHGDELKLVVAYTHAIGADQNQKILLSSDPGNFLTPQDIAGLQLGVIGGMFLLDNPLIVLSGCETGALGLEVRGEGESFMHAFLSAGAGGVITTEATISDGAGLYVTQQLLKQALDQGKPVAESMWRIRRALWKGGDPSGLMFAYHGALDLAYIRP